jgi:cadmium resistance protein CadD (predicted permease)
VCSAAKADLVGRGAAKPRLLGLLGIGIGIELGWLDNRSDTDTDTDTDTDADRALSV